MTLNNAAIELSLTLDWWSDTVGVFEPELVFRRIHQIFPDTIFDPIDYQEQQLRKEVAHWQSAVSHPVQQAKLIQQSKDNYRTNGPTFKCTIPFKPSWHVEGIIRRLSVRFLLPPALPRTCQQQIEAFLRSLAMGQPTYAYKEAVNTDSTQ
jgi:hypothetical protein